jgi:integrase/recombinase XerD
MTRLRKMMLEELQRRNYAQNTIRHYLRTVEEFARRFHCSPDRLGPRHIREYQAELFQKGKSPGTVTQHRTSQAFGVQLGQLMPISIGDRSACLFAFFGSALALT